MSTSSAVPVRTRRVASRLRDLRRRSGLSAPEVSQALGISMSKISRMESGQRGLNVDDVAAMLGLYRVSSCERAEVLELVRSGADRNWWSVRPNSTNSVESGWNAITTFERESVAMHVYETMLVPGLLQTPDYVLAMANALKSTSPEVEIDALLEQRVERQTLMHSSRRFEFLIEQTVLERPIGGAEVMAHQLQRLSAIAERPNVDLQVLPTAVGAHAGMNGPFLWLEFDEHADLVLCESMGCSSYLEDESLLAHVREMMRRLRAASLPPWESIELLDKSAAMWSHRA